MSQTISFGDALEAASELTRDEQEMLVDILQHRIREQRRSEIKNDVDEARKDFEQGNFKRLSVADIMREVQLWDASSLWWFEAYFEFVNHEGNEAILLQSIGTHDEVY